MKKTWLLWIYCLWVSLQVSYAQEKRPTLWKSPEGKYFATFYKSEIFTAIETNTQGKPVFYLLPDNLPEELQVQVRNLYLNKTLIMTTKRGKSYSKFYRNESNRDSLSVLIRYFSGDFSPYEALRDSVSEAVYTRDSLSILMNNLVSKRNKMLELKDSLDKIVIRTPDDTLRAKLKILDDSFKTIERFLYIVEREVFTSNSIQEKISTITDSLYKTRYKHKYNELFEIKCYVPIDSLLKDIETKTNQEKLRSFKYLFDFMRELNLQEAIDYGEKALKWAKLTQNVEIEAELLLSLSNLKNKNVGRIYKLEYEYTPKNPDEVLKFGAIPLTYKSHDEVIKAIAKKTNFSPADIKRWNNIWGYDNELGLHGSSQEVKLYDDVKLLSDKELLEYLKIRIAQKDTNKIVWAYNALGNLYQIKYGYDEAEKYYLEMLKIRTQQQDNEKIYWVWGRLGYFYLKQEKFDLSIAYFTKLLEARKQEKNVEQIIWALGGLRFAKLSQGLPEEALAYQEQIFELYADLKQHPDKYYGDDPKDYRYLVLSVVISDYLKAFPDKSKAISDYLVKWRKGKPDGKENKIIANKIIEIATETGELDSAIEVIKEIVKAEKDTLAKINYLNDIAFMYQKQGKFKESIDFYQQATKEAKKSKNKLLTAIQHKKMGFFYRAQNKDKEAQKEYSKLLETLKKMQQPSYKNDEYSKEYQYNSFVYSLVEVCQYLQTFPTQKEQVKGLAKEVIRLTDDRSIHLRFSEFLKNGK